MEFFFLEIRKSVDSSAHALRDMVLELRSTKEQCPDDKNDNPNSRYLYNSLRAKAIELRVRRTGEDSETVEEDLRRECSDYVKGWKKRQVEGVTINSADLERTLRALNSNVEARLRSEPGDPRE